MRKMLVNNIKQIKDLILTRYREQGRANVCEFESSKKPVSRAFCKGLWGLNGGGGLVRVTFANFKTSDD